MDLEDPIVHAPEFPDSVWLNAFTEISQVGLRGKAVLIEFWDFTCINCIRTLPYVRAWYERYNDLGLEIIGVHTPEFSFARDRKQVKAALGRLGIRWPVILDNEQTIWTSYANRYWPTFYLIDARGYIRYRQAGEGYYTQIEEALRALLRERKPQVELPSILPPLRPEDAPGAVCEPTTPELHIDALGNSSSPADNTTYRLPDDLHDGHFYLEGDWRVTGEGLTMEARDGAITLLYHAADVHTVVAPSADPDRLEHFFHDPLIVRVTQDEEPVPYDCFGTDLLLDHEHTILRVDAPRSYSLIHDQAVQPHSLRLAPAAVGFTLYAFSFGSCISDDPPAVLKIKE